MFKFKGKALLVFCVTLLYVIFFLNNLSIPLRTFSENREINFVHYIYAFKENTDKRSGGSQNSILEPQTTDYIISSKDEGIELKEQLLSFMSQDELPVSETKEQEQKPVVRKEPVVRKTPAKNSTSKSTSRSRMLLSDNGFLKALTRLTWKDKLWLTKILSRCSLEEFMQVKDMLKDGVTWKENKAMFLILRSKITDDEQEKLDSLIEACIR